MDVPARGDVVAPPAGADWFANANDLPRAERQAARVRLPGRRQPATIYGTDVYTDDSSVCTAAVHDGKITIADGGTVTVEIRPGAGLVRAHDAERGHELELRLVERQLRRRRRGRGRRPAGVKMGGGGWTADGDDHRGHNGSRYLYVCPSGGTVSARSGARTSTPTTAPSAPPQCRSA